MKNVIISAIICRNDFHAVVIEKSRILTARQYHDEIIVS